MPKRIANLWNVLAIISFILLLIFVKIAFAGQCRIYDCDGYEIKVCGREKIYCRNYSCENECLDKNMAEFRKTNSTENWDIFGFDKAVSDWENFKQYEETHPCDCPEKWNKCQKDIYYQERIQKCGENSLCSMYKDQNNDCKPEW